MMKQIDNFSWENGAAVVLTERFDYPTRNWVGTSFRPLRLSIYDILRHMEIGIISERSK